MKGQSTITIGVRTLVPNFAYVWVSPIYDYSPGELITLQMRKGTRVRLEHLDE